MYSVDEQDRVVELTGFPQSSVGAPCPAVIADEHRLLVAFYVDGAELGQPDGPALDSLEAGGEVAVVAFRDHRALLFGPPNDEAFSGHPLAGRGLHPYGAFEVQHSSWIRRLERMSSVHPAHRPAGFSALRHFVLTFHDSTFECVAKGYEVRLVAGPVLSALDEARREAFA